MELALTLLDGADIVPGRPLKVSKATFEKSGTFVKAKKTAASSQAVMKIRKRAEQQALSWSEEGMDDDPNGMRIVVLAHMFAPEDFKGALAHPCIRCVHVCVRTCECGRGARCMPPLLCARIMTGVVMMHRRKPQPINCSIHLPASSW